jgi:hypothetical protein
MTSGAQGAQYQAGRRGHGNNLENKSSIDKDY